MPPAQFNIRFVKISYTTDPRLENTRDRSKSCLVRQLQDVKITVGLPEYLNAQYVKKFTSGGLLEIGFCKALKRKPPQPYYDKYRILLMNKVT